MTGRLRTVVAVLACLGLVAIAGWAAYRALRDPPQQDGWEARPPAQGEPVRPVEPTTGQRAEDGGPRYVSAVSADGRHFVDQDGEPILVRGDAPWSLLVDLTPDEAEAYLTTRSQQGFNAMVVSLLGDPANGGPHGDGTTVDGLAPFVDGDVTRPSGPYWDRAHAVLARAAELGITALLYPVDSWTIDRVFSPSSAADCTAYGEHVGAWAADLPNILWMTGGDYTPTPEHDACFMAVQEGIRATGDRRPFSAQLITVRSPAEDEHWAPLVDWDFVYTYQPVHEAVRQAYDDRWVRPSLLSESNYEGENNTGGPLTTTETLRRQVLWAVTSGSPGDIFGTDDWEFLPGWEDRLRSEGAEQVSRLRDLVAALPWWTLVPDDGRLLRAGAGGEQEAWDQLESDLATAAVSPGGDLALVYVPTERTITLGLDQLGPGSGAQWVDPSTGTAVPATLEETMTTPGANAAGGQDWLLVLGTHPVT